MLSNRKCIFVLPSGRWTVSDAGCAATTDVGRRHGHAIKIGRSNLSRRPSESAGFDLLDFVDAFRRGVEPDADVAVTRSKLRRQVLYGNPGPTGRLQGLDDSLFQWSARRSPFSFGRCDPGHALFSASLRPAGFGRR